MRRCLTALLLAAAPAAWAQTTPDGAIAVPPAPAIVAAPPGDSAPAPTPDTAPPPGLVQTPVPAANADGGGAPPADNGGTAGTPSGTAATNPAAPPDVAPTIPNTWVPAQRAELGVLDKVDGAITKLTVPVGGQAAIGDLQVAVQACDTRPPGQLPDASVFVTLTDPKGDDSAPLFKGWMVRSEPGATVVGDADETLRVIGCD